MRPKKTASGVLVKVESKPKKTRQGDRIRSGAAQYRGVRSSED